LAKSTKTDLEKSTAICDDLKVQIKTQKDSADEGFSTAVKARVELEGRGAKVLGEDTVLDSMTDREIKEKVIENLRSDVVLTDKSDEYVNARFEVCLEDHAAKAEGDLGNRINNTDSKDENKGAETARKAQWDHDSKLWETK